ncbi:MAG: hypothetical protein Q7T55_14025, partial [Solirubrobacteraceae bacterium]|nr:hypothetical protein [Solirubrobacteraceae bacterium]
AQEVAPFGIRVTIVEPGPFRTDFLSPSSIRFGEHRVTDSDEWRDALRASFEQRDGKQPGDPVRLAEASVKLAREPEPPLRFAAGRQATDSVCAKLADMRGEVERWRALSVETDYAA